MKDSITRSFEKGGLSVALDGSENDEVNIDGLPDYQIPSAFMQNNEYVLNNDDESEKENEDKGNAENEEEFQILIYSNLPIVIEWYSIQNRIKEPRQITFSFYKEFLFHNSFTALVIINMNFYPKYKPMHFLIDFLLRV